jgi:hypothetical protein
VADEHEPVDHALDTLLTNKGARKQQVVDKEQEQDQGSSKDEAEGLQQEMNIVVIVVTTERASRSLRPASRRQSLPDLELSPEPSYNEAGSRYDRNSDDELNYTDLD